MVNNKPASAYAKPHTMSGKTVGIDDYGKRPSMPRKKNWTPLDGVSMGSNDDVKTSGIKIRGTGAATKGVMARGPMA
jgi:hypothetical protein